MKISNEVRFGIFAVIAIAAFVFGMSYMKGSKLFGDSLVLISEYNNSGGIIKGSPVLISGQSVGKVMSTRLDQSSRKVIITMDLDPELEIPHDSKAVIFNSDLLGSKAIKLDWGKSHDYLASADTINGTVELSITDKVQEELLPVKEAIVSLLQQVDSVVQWTSTTLVDVEGKENIAQIIRNVNKTSENVRNITARADSLVGTLNTLSVTATNVVKNVESNNDNVNEIVDNVRVTTDTLVEASNQIQAIINDAQLTVDNIESIVDKLESDENTMGKLINDDQLYQDITGSVATVTELIEAIKKDPQKYLDLDVYIFENGKKYKRRNQEKETSN